MFWRYKNPALAVKAAGLFIALCVCLWASLRGWARRWGAVAHALSHASPDYNYTILRGGQKRTKADKSGHVKNFSQKTSHSQDKYTFSVICVNNGKYISFIAIDDE